MTNKLLGWARTHRPQAALGAGAVGAVGIGLYRRHRANAGATTTSGVPTDATSASVAPASSSDTAGGVGYDPSAFDSSASSYLPQISQQLSTLNAGVAGLMTATTAGAPKPAPASSSTRHQAHLAHETHLQHVARTGGTMTTAPIAPKPMSAHERHLAAVAHRAHLAHTGGG